MQKNFVVYKSSAGSGKTFTLVKEYLKIALSDDSPRPIAYKKILAITFTNKAAAEMKLRIIEALKLISQQNSKSDALITAIQLETNIPKEILIARATSNLNEILHNYSDFSISTIDSFTHKIVKTFAFDLKLPVNFTIETNTAEFYRKVVSGLMSKIGENEELTNLLIQYSSNNAEENNAWDPEKKLLEFVDLIQKEDAGKFLEKLKRHSTDELREIQSQLHLFVSGFRKKLKDNGEEAIRLIRNQHLKDENFIYGNTGPQNVFKKWVDFNYKEFTELTGARLKEAVDKNKWNSSKNSAAENAALESITPKLTSIASETIAFIEQNALKFNLYNLLEKNIYSIILVNELQQISEEFRAEEQIVFISDFNSKIAKVVSEEPAPFIYERLGERFSTYLLDEFQDTSTLQWLNLLPLIDNSLANGKFNLIVGDGKQSIYRWRNANVQQFNILPEVKNTTENTIIHERAAALIQNFKAEFLNTNYRSLKNIIEFNNAVFDFLPDQYLKDELKSIYQNQAQKIRHNNGGYVSLHFGNKNKDDLEKMNFELIEQQIQSAIQHHFTYNDICIIVRNNNHGNICANFLLEKGIPVISSDSLLLKNNAEINCVIAFLTYLNNPSDTISAAVVVNYVSENSTLSNHLKQLSATNDLFSVLKKQGVELNLSSFIQKNIIDVCIEIVTKLKLEQKAAQYIRFFLDEVNDYLVNKTGSINDFLYWWNKRKEKASLIIPDGTNAVRIMTVHKSKGLEFPVVILPFTNWPSYQPNQAWVDLEDRDSPLSVGLFKLTQGLKEAGLDEFYQLEKQEQNLDNLNLLYVAFTRAVERLHIIAFKSEGQKTETVADWLINYLTNNIGVSDEVYELGALETKLLNERHTTLYNFDISNLHFNSNKDLIKIKGSHNLKIQGAVETALEKGIKMHYILSEINSDTEVPFILEKMMKQGIIPESERSELELKIKEILRHELLKNYFSGNVRSKNEAEIITESGTILRPDKIIFDTSCAVVIDYKTGKPNTKKYALQMSEYAVALQKMGHQQVKKLLVYLDENSVEEVF